jgi:hypothetical protein
MNRRFIPTVLAAAAVALAGCGSTINVSHPTSQQRQELNRKVDRINAELAAWSYCSSLGLEKYSQCMVNRGYSPDGSGSPQLFPNGGQ